MKLLTPFFLAFLWLNLMFSQQAQAVPTLRASDLVVVDFQQDDTDGFKVLVLAPIPANSVLFFTDAQWLADGNLSATNQGNTEWQLRWTSPATVVPAGTIITFTVPATTATADLGTITTIATTLTPNGGLTFAGDQLVIYQTDDNTASLLSSKIQRLNAGGTPEAGPIYSFNADNALGNNAWSANLNGWGTVPNTTQASPGISPSGSHTPPNSVVFDNSGDPNRTATNAFGLGTFDITNAADPMGNTKDLDNLRYNGPITAATKTAWLIRIHNPANWIGRDDTSWSVGQGTLSNVTSAPVGSFTAPVVTNVTSSTANGAYNASDVISIQVTFDASVTVTGTPQLTLETGTTDRVVNLTSGSPGTTLTFNYTVQTGDTAADLDYISTTALALNGGTIVGTSGSVAATLTLPSPGAANSLGANKALVIDTTAPTIAIGSPSVSTIAAGAGSVTYTVTYADTNFNASTLANGNITLNSTGSASGTVNVTGSGTTRTVTISSITGTGTLGITIASGTASDTAGNTAGAAGPSTTFAVTAPASGPSPTGTPAHQFTNSSTMASFTVPAGPRRLLVVSAGDPGTPTNPTSVTFNGMAMSLGNSTSDGFFSCDSIWYLALGNGAAVTGSINVAFGGSEFRYIGAASFSNVDQTTPVDTNGPKISGQVTGTNPSSSLNVTS